MDNLTYIKEHLLSPVGIDEAFLAQALSQLSERKIDFGDLFFEHEVSESFALDENIVKGGSFAISGGVGVRGVLGEKCGFAYSDVIEKQAILDACMAARSISAGHNCSRVAIEALHPKQVKALYSQENPLNSLSRAEKIKILTTANEIARGLDPRVDQVAISLHQSHRMMLVADTDGSIAADVKPVVQFSVQVVMRDGERRESGMSSMGGAYLLDEIIKGDAFHDIAKDAVRMASVKMQAVAAPAGMMPVVLGAGWPGVLIHEAVGHGLEADENYINASAYSGRVGEKVASDACTIIDDGTIARRRGSQSFDDEGTPTQSNVLIEKGVLKGYMHDRKSAMLMKMAPTGNGRRESYDYPPLPRMTNTYMMPGEYDKEEIIASVDKGIYAVNFSGGQVDPTSGRFVFSTSEAFLIENGKVTTPIKGATLIGNGPETMKKVSMVANDLQFDPGVGFCGKQGQSLMVGIGQPTLKIDEITVGGTQN